MFPSIKRFACLVFGAAVLGAAGLVSADPAVAAQSNGGVRIMPLGDSLTDGLTVPGSYRISLWQQLTAAGATVDFVGSLSNGPSQLGDRDHEGHSGWRIDQIDAQVKSWMTTTTPKTVLLMIGTNDITQNYSLAQAPTRLSNLIDHIYAVVPNAYVFVASIPPLGMGFGTQIDQYNGKIPGIVQAKASAGKNAYFVDIHAVVTTSDLQDGVHCNANGYTKMANAWFAAMKKVPASYSTTTTPPAAPVVQLASVSSASLATTRAAA